MRFLAFLLLFGLSTPTPEPTLSPAAQKYVQFYAHDSVPTVGTGTVQWTITNPTEFESCPDARYLDDKKVAWACKNCECIPYYQELVDHGNDPGKCGIKPFETGTWDPLYFVCRRHDAMYDYQKDNNGKVKESIIKTQAQFTLDAATAALRGLYAIGAFFIYVPLVWTIGLGIQGWRRWTGNDK